jgi:hypothetical protein
MAEDKQLLTKEKDPEVLKPSPYAVIFRHYNDGTTKSDSIVSEEQLKTAVNTLKANKTSSLVSFDIYIRKETFTKQQIWSNSND